jgi:hypothetical protein
VIAVPDPFADLVFTESHRFRPFDVVAPGFVVVSLGDLGPTREVTRDARSPVAPFAAVEVDVRRSGPDAVVVAGLTGDHAGILATYDAAAGRIRIEAYVDGRRRVLRSRRARLTDGTTLAFVVCENQVTVLARSADAWVPLLTERDRVRDLLDLRDPEVLAGLSWTWGVRTGEADLGGVRAGPFGMTGLRDPHLVQHADGSPYTRDGRVLMTWTCAGPGFFQQAHWGVFALDPELPGSLEQVAQLYTRRDGLLVGDHSGQLVRDGDRWLVMTSSWGDFDPATGTGVHVRHLVTDADLLSGVHVLGTEPTPLPTTASTWDPACVRDGDGWLLGYVESPSQTPFRFHPALARTTSTYPWEGLERIGGADELRQCEGPVLVRRHGATWLLASDQRHRRFPVFDTGMRAAGSLRSTYPTNIPHPQLLERPDGSWLMLTFDGTPVERRATGRRSVMGYGGHGDVVVMTGTERGRDDDRAGERA